ncbi:MAG: FHA domain-containing protein [Microthrixaceae bacterium]
MGASGRHRPRSCHARDTGISRVHARLEPRGAGDGWLIVDLDSANGTMVNAVRVEDAPCPVYEGDVVFVGMWTALALRRS